MEGPLGNTILFDFQNSATDWVNAITISRSDTNNIEMYVNGLVLANDIYATNMRSKNVVSKLPISFTPTVQTTINGITVYTINSPDTRGNKYMLFSSKDYIYFLNSRDFNHITFIATDNHYNHTFYCFVEDYLVSQ